jgi:tetratricopeptide (TPR) repeat protein
MEWVHEHTGVVLGVIVAIIVGGAVLGVSSAVSKNKNGEASVAYGKALEAYEAPVGDAAKAEKGDGPHYKDATERAQASREMFRDVVAKYGATGAANLANLYIGHTSMKLNDADSAKAAYQSFLDGADKADPLRFAGYTGLAAATEAKGDRKSAIAALEELLKLNDKVDHDGALLDLGRLQKLENNPTAARQAWERIGKEFPESPLKSRADELIALLGDAGKVADAAKPAEKPAP